MRARSLLFIMLVKHSRASLTLRTTFVASSDFSVFASFSPFLHLLSLIVSVGETDGNTRIFSANVALYSPTPILSRDYAYH